MASPPPVAIIMGSQSDWATMRHAAETLDALGVPYDARIVSAHRTPTEVAALASSARELGYQAFICGAGMAAHLAGAVAAHTTLPVVGVPLSGGASYRVKLPPNIPAANFWSLTLYEAENASGLANGQPFPSLGSRDKPAQNADGSTDLYLGPKAPEGKQGNWLATVPGKGYFAILRLYSPTEAAINKRWKPGDIERVN